MVVNAAISKKGGVTYFPTGARSKVGVGNLSLNNCATNTTQKVKDNIYQEVDGFTLETHVKNMLKAKVQYIT